MRTRIALVLLASIISMTFVCAQSPNPPVVIQAVGQQAPRAAAAAAPTAQAIDSSGAILKALQEMKTANDELLKKQAEELQLLEDIAARAEQLKIYTKRG